MLITFLVQFQFQTAIWIAILFLALRSFTVVQLQGSCDAHSGHAKDEVVDPFEHFPARLRKTSTVFAKIIVPLTVKILGAPDETPKLVYYRIKDVKRFMVCFLQSHLCLFFLLLMV
jgi:hypothetical protein